MALLKIKTNFPEVDRNLRKLRLDVQKKVVPAALNKTAKKASTEMTRAITQEFNIKRADVSKRIRIIRASRKLDQWFCCVGSIQITEAWSIVELDSLPRKEGDTG